jgi:hypothetical protein
MRIIHTFKKKTQLSDYFLSNYIGVLSNNIYLFAFENVNLKTYYQLNNQ